MLNKTLRGKQNWLKLDEVWERSSSSLILLSILVVGLLVRFYDLSDPPLDFHPTRQLHSLIIARGYYFQYAAGVTEDQRQMAWEQSVAEGRIEPPIFEWLTAQTYRILGAETVTTARVYSILIWMLGGVVIYSLYRKDLSRPASLVGLAYYVTVPYAIYASRSFQPDPLMTFLLVLSWFLAMVWLKQPSGRNAILAGAIGGITLLVKTTAGFYLGGILIGIVIATKSFKVVRNWQTWLLLFLLALPTAVYAVFVWWSPSASGGITSLRFFPSYWTQLGFYLTWFNMLDEKIGLIWIILSMLGGMNLQSRWLKGAFWGGLAGYVLMGFALSHHISTHDYYSLPLIPILGLGFGGLLELVRKGLPENNRTIKIGMAGLLFVLFLGNVYQARMTLKRTDYREEPTFWQNVAGEIAPYSPVIGLTQDYGLRLTYYGGISIDNWFTSDEIRLRLETGQEITSAGLFQEKTQNAGGFLVTNQEEFSRQPELQQFLESNYAEVSSLPGALLFDLRTKIEK